MTSEDEPATPGPPAAAWFGAERLTALLVALAALGYATHLALAPMGETDLFFHLKLGDVIRARGAIPFRNLFSFTWPDAPDLDLSWAFQVAVSRLYAWDGFRALVLGKALCFVLACALAYRGCRRAGAGPLGSAVALLVTSLVAEPRLVERPHLVTFVGIAGFRLLLVEVERGERRWLYVLPPLTVLWANFHAGVFLAPILLFGTAAGVALDRRWGSSDERIPLRPLWVIAILSVICMFATPAGAMLPRYLLWHTGLGATRNIEEFRVAEFASEPWFFVMLGASALHVVFLGRQARWRLMVPALVVAPLACRSVRFVAEWAFIAAPALSVGWARISDQIKVLVSPEVPDEGNLTGGGRRDLLHYGLRIGLVLAVAAGIVSERLERGLELGLAEDVVPFDAIRFVTNNGLRDRMFHDLDVGCYLLWEGWPRYQVFQDARLPAYPDEFHRSLDQTPLEPAAFDALLKRYGVETALINYPYINIRAGCFDPEEWAMVYRSDEAMVFARRLPRFDAVIARFEIPLRVRFKMVGGSSFEPIEEQPARSSVPPAEWSVRLRKVTPRARLR